MYFYKSKTYFIYLTLYINILAYYYTFVSEFGVSNNHFICIDSFGFWTTNVKNYTINCHKPGITAFADQHTVSLRPFVSLVRTTLRYDEKHENWIKRN